MSSHRWARPSRRTAAEHVARALAGASEPAIRPWVGAVGTAAAYFLLAVLLDGPIAATGRIVPIWPAAGIAAAAALRVGGPAYPAVFLAAAANVMVWSGAAAWVSAVTVGVAATAQAATTRLLVRAFIGEADELLTAKDVLKFIAAVGPIGCAVGAFLAPPILAMSGAAPDERLPLDVARWWVGDAIGAVIVTPIALSLIGSPRACWAPRQSRVALPLLLLLVAISYGAGREHQRFEEKGTAELEEVGYGAAVELRSEIDRGIEAVRGLASHFLGSQDVSPEEFEGFTSRLASRIETMSGLLWVAPTPDGSREVIVYAHPRARASLIGTDPRGYAPLGTSLDRATVGVSPVLSAPVVVESARNPAMAVAALVPAADGVGIRGWTVGLIGVEELKNLVASVTRTGAGPPFQICVRGPDDRQGVCPSHGRHADVQVHVGGALWTMRISDPLGTLQTEEDRTLFQMLLIFLGLSSIGSWVLLVLSGRNIALQIESAGRDRAERALGDLAAALQDSNRELEQFAYMASHDLRAPLRAINGLSEWIAEESGDQLTGESARYLELLRGRVARMDAMITALLNFSRAGRRRDPVEPVDVGVLVDEVVDLHGDSRFEITHGTLPTVVGHRAPLMQVFTNLVANAINHHDRDTGHVTISARRGDDAIVEFRVEDDGPGIPARFADAVFEPFRTLKSRDDVEGSGMGLATVRRLVEAEGGTIHVEERDGRGAAFVFTWPRVSHTDDDPDSDLGVRPPSGSARMSPENHG